MVRPVRGALSSAHSAHRTPTNRARVRAHLLMVAVAAQHVSVRVHFFRLAPAPPVRRLELALTRAGYGARQTFVSPYRGVCPPNPTDRVQIPNHGTRHLRTATTTNPIPASFEQTQRVPPGHPDVCPCDVCGATNNHCRLLRFTALV